MIATPPPHRRFVFLQWPHVRESELSGRDRSQADTGGGRWARRAGGHGGARRPSLHPLPPPRWTQDALWAFVPVANTLFFHTSTRAATATGWPVVVDPFDSSLTAATTESGEAGAAWTSQQERFRRKGPRELVSSVSPGVRGAAPGLWTIYVGRGRVRPLSTLVPHGSEFPRICGRGGKGTQKADRVEKLTLHVHTELRNLKALKKCFLLRYENKECYSKHLLSMFYF